MTTWLLAIIVRIMRWSVALLTLLLSCARDTQGADALDAGMDAMASSDAAASFPGTYEGWLTPVWEDASIPYDTPFLPSEPFQVIVQLVPTDGGIAFIYLSGVNSDGCNCDDEIGVVTAGVLEFGDTHWDCRHAIVASTEELDDCTIRLVPAGIDMTEDLHDTFYLETADGGTAVYEFQRRFHMLGYRQ